MEQHYQPKNIEQQHYKRWEENNYFQPQGPGEPFCIVIPPPNVTGTLHMGHAFQDTIMDALTRYHRMMGYNTLWQPGMDHAGIATQMVVERILNSEGYSRLDMKREDFIKRIWNWKDQSGGAIAMQLRRLGASLDWNRDCFTMDPKLNDAVIDVFIKLYEEGLIYRGKRLVNWDPILHTALSDLEVLVTEEKGQLWHFRYHLADNEKYVVVATTRPETVLGDSAIAVNPDDHRYKDLIGKEAIVPIVNRKIPIIADDYVDPKFGSGCVKITPAHDFNDYEIGMKHKLPLINIFDNNAKLNQSTPKEFQGLTREEARKKIVADFESLQLIEKIENHTINIPRGDRSGSIIEPYLTNQWYVDIKPLAKPAIKAVENKEIRFVPNNWSKTYFEWMENIQDWCISRQLWWGHRIPAWYDEKNNIYVGKNEKAIRDKFNLQNQVKLKQDEDVLDTWFSSALWPFSTQGWPDDTQSFKTFYPGQVLVTGFDIIFFWVARMIMMGIKFTGKVPFKEVYIHGLIRDQYGQKMSKSKGNVLDPLDLIDGTNLENLLKKRTAGLMQDHLKPEIEKNTIKQFPNGIEAYGADALRFTFASLATTGRDIRFDFGRIEGYKNFCNKLWNAAHYTLLNTKGLKKIDQDDIEYTTVDYWIKSELNNTTKKIHTYFKKYRFDLAAQCLHEFIWHEFCDWYLELSKAILHNKDFNDKQKLGTKVTLIETLENILRLLHPIMPFITEEIWLNIKQKLMLPEETIMLRPYPTYDISLVNDKAEDKIKWVKEFILGIRKIRGEMNISPGKMLSVTIKNNSKKEKDLIKEYNNILQHAGRIKGITFLKKGGKEPLSSTAMHGKMKLLVPISDLIDIADELDRLEKQKITACKEINKSELKLNNTSFLSNAPIEIIEKEKQRISKNKNLLKELQKQIKKLSKTKD
ncbi:MAG TPA: valine--tRNA ligase [Woeseiaceae bacterium]|nr:valine--tRNA ligase [Woeseiaceae bacterium]